jgi:hypothetical protein
VPDSAAGHREDIPMLGRRLAASIAALVLIAASEGAAAGGVPSKEDGGGERFRLTGSIAGFVGLGSVSPDNTPVLDVFGGESRVQLPLFGDDGGRGREPAGVRRFFTIQGDATFDSWRFDSDPWNFASLIAHVTYNNIAYHLTPARTAAGTMRNEFNLDPSWRIGVYGGLLDAEATTRHTVAGFEAQYYARKNLQFEARAGAYWAGGERLNSLYGAGRYFIGSNLYLQGSGSVSQFADGGDLLTTFAGKFEYKFAGSPLALFTELNFGQHGDVFGVHDGRVGARFLFGEPSLKADLVKGASFGRELMRPVWLAD